MSNCKITNERFSVRFCKVMEHFDIKTVGKAKQFLSFYTSPNSRVYYTRTGHQYTRKKKLTMEIKSFERVRNIANEKAFR